MSSNSLCSIYDSLTNNFIVVIKFNVFDYIREFATESCQKMLDYLFVRAQILGNEVYYSIGMCNELSRFRDEEMVEFDQYLSKLGKDKYWMTGL